MKRSTHSGAVGKAPEDRRLKGKDARKQHSDMLGMFGRLNIRTLLCGRIIGMKTTCRLACSETAVLALREIGVFVLLVCLTSRQVHQVSF